ncbi:trypsin-like peptidase domain-containing protein [Streptomyces sp. TRM49041]|uniref:trypsin-like peptidase domain-containing protein n=1 Tax=Streptomyces sp. TRM49041 TaxID=2603216 RepID=UPI00165685B0|nr:trypsin-like peptidase domain-containing protein [Streptomyces sp. TRM49041]
MGRGDRETLVRICDQAGSSRGTGFVADDRGTVVTSHETVDGLERVVVRAPDGRTCTAEAEAVTALPGQALALIHTEGLGVRPLAIADREAAPEAGAYVRVHAHGWREARVLGTARATYTATEGLHTVDEALELAIGTDGSEALRRGGEAAGGPVLDATTGTVLAVLTTALHTDHRAAGLAVPLARAAAGAPGVAEAGGGGGAAARASDDGRAVAPASGGSLGVGHASDGGALAALLRRNAATVPAHGPDLNLAGTLELTRTTRPPVNGSEPVARLGIARELDRFVDGDGDGAVAGAVVCGLVGAPGSGRTTELGALADRRGSGDAPAPTVWLRGADLRPGDASVGDAVGRVLGRAGRVVAAAGGDWSAYPEARDGGLDGVATGAARLARDAGRPLVVLLDAPEEMPPPLAHRLREWTAGTVRWLRTHGVRLVVACRPEHWEVAGALYPEGTLYRPAEPAAPAAPAEPAEQLPDAVPIGDLSADEAELARQRYGLPERSIAAADARHPLALRLLAEVRAALPGAVPGRPGRADVFAAHLDLLCLRVAARIGAGCRPPLPDPAVRRLAARVAGRAHDAARRCLVPGHGELDREAFEELFPWGTGWASAVLTEGLLVPAGAGYRFAHEEFADWIQGAHIDVDAALEALVQGRGGSGELPAALPCRGPAEHPEHLVPAQRPAPAARPEHLVPAQHPAPAGPVPRHRIGAVLQALLLLERGHGTAALARRLERLVGTVAASSEAAWWGARLLREALLRVADARPYLGVLRLLAARVAARPTATDLDEHGPWFWEHLHLTEDERLDLLRRLLPADGPPNPPTAPDTSGRAPDRGSAPGRQVGAGARGASSPARSSGGAEPTGEPASSGSARPTYDPGSGTTYALPGGHGSSADSGWRGPGSSDASGSWSAGAPGPSSARRSPGGSDASRAPALPEGAWAAGGPPSENASALSGASGTADASGAAGAPGTADAPGFAGGPVPAGEPGGPRLPLEAGSPVAARWSGGPRSPRASCASCASCASGGPGSPGAADSSEAARSPDASRAPGGQQPSDVSRLCDDPGCSGAVGLSGASRSSTGPGDRSRPRYLEAVVRRLVADPRGVQPLLCRWFADERPLPGEAGARGRLTVAGVAQALLHAHRGPAVDDLCEVLVTTAHARADELLGVLVDDEPGALCRAVDRWAHDDARPTRRVAAATYGRLLAERVSGDADRELLRYAALALLARPGDQALHGAALAMLVRDPHSRSRYLPRALAAFTAGDCGLPARTFTAALTTHPEPVLAAFHARLRTGGLGAAADVLDTLADVRTPALARRAAALVHAYVDRHPEGAAHAAAYVDRRLEQGPAARAVLFPLVTDLLRGHTVELRGALASVLAAPGTGASLALRDELLDVLLEHEQHECRDLAVPDVLLRAAALGAAGRPEARTRELVLRTGHLLIRTPEGATCFDRRLAELARDVPGFAVLVSGWLAGDPQRWAAVVGPSTRRTVERLAAPGTDPGPDAGTDPGTEAETGAVAVPALTAMPMRAEPRGHGTLRPA